MANRSYLYNIAFNRVNGQKTPEDQVLSVSEYSYRIPLAFKILLSDNTQISPSILWDYECPIAIIGDTVLGKAHLFDFLNDLLQKNLFDAEYLQKEVIKTKHFFKQNSLDLKYFFLEAGELYEMEDTPFEKQNFRTFEEIKNIHLTIMSFYSTVEKLNSEIEELKARMNKKSKISWFKKENNALSKNHRSKIETEISKKELEKNSLLGIDNWRTILYYQFTNE
jgi:hypothetical protein